MRREEKQAIFEALLSEHPIVRVGVLNTGKGVELPPQLKEEPCIVTLEYGLNMARPIPDLMVGPDGIHATLSFSRQLHKTFAPWDSIAYFGVQEGDEDAAPLSRVRAPKKAAPKLRAVAEDEAPPEDLGAPPERRPPVLAVVR